MKKDFDESFDAAHGGWGFGHRYIDADSFDYAMAQAESGDSEARLDCARPLMRRSR